MLEAVKKEFLNTDALIMAAAVADYEPVNYIDHKIKKREQGNELKIFLKETPDILKTMGNIKQENQVVVGFAAETNDLLKNAAKKLEEKNADMIVANDVSHGVFGSNEDQVTVLRKGKEAKSIKETTKVEIAKQIINLVADKLESRKVKNEKTLLTKRELIFVCLMLLVLLGLFISSSMTYHEQEMSPGFIHRHFPIVERIVGRWNILRWTLA